MTIRGAMRIRGGFFAILALLCLMIAVIAVGQSQSGTDTELASSDELAVGSAEEAHDHDADGHAHGEGEDGDHAHGDGDHADGDHADHADGDHADGDHAHGDGDHADGDHAHGSGDPNHAHNENDPAHAHSADDPNHADDPDHAHPNVPGEPPHEHPTEPPPSVYTQVQLDLLAATQAAIYPRFATTQAAEAAGYRSIGDAVTGFEHFVNNSYLNHPAVLDPATIESLVYQVGPGNTRTLVSGMYILPIGQTLNNVPAAFDTPQSPWHIHTNLCWAAGGGGLRVVGTTTNGQAGCPSGSVYFVTPPMLHVWVEEQPCGWFSDLEQVDTGDCSAHPH